jgi:ATP-dependent HslUV protease subunit HslV
MRGTTIVVVRKGGETVMAADGQVTLGEVALKHNARKLQRLFGGKVLVGFSGAVADSLTLLEKFEEKLKEYQGDVRRSAIELAKQWRTDRILRRLDAMLLVADKDNILLISGGGEVIEPEKPAVGIGSGGAYAYAAALALLDHSELPATRIAEEALKIAARLCIYTNENIIVEKL